MNVQIEAIGVIIMPKIIFFDLDDTLLWDKKSIDVALFKTCEIAAKRFGFQAEDFLEVIRTIAPKIYSEYDTHQLTKDIGINPFEGLWGKFDDDLKIFERLHEVAPKYQQRVWTEGLEQMGVTDLTFGEKLAKEFPEIRVEHPYIYEETFEVLDKLLGKYKMFLITNGAPSLQNRKLSITPKLLKYFDEVIISGAVGYGKPESKIFEYALEKADLTASDAWMVGDNLHTDIIGANQMQITSIWINHYNRDVKDIIPTYEISRLNELTSLLKLEETRSTL